ncbi:MAG TPA: PAS domain S-box protein [Stellaceae bacterium]|nr:PAS domain S-box protein [Stellaceae bacterium]
MSVDPDRFSRTLAREAPDAVIYADAKGVIGFWNKGAERIFGFSEAEALGKTLDIIIPETLRARHWTGYAATMQSGKTRYGAGDLLAVPALRKDAARISVEFTVLLIRDDNGVLAGIAAILRDVTPRFEEMKRLRQAAAARTKDASG